jgi:GntR family transcriptional regulator/MocR family aminotransferase
VTAPRKRIAVGNGPPLRISRADADAGTPLYRQIYLQLRERIESGGLVPGERLPAARTLVQDLGVSRNTIEGALQLLVAEGWIVRRVGSGSAVAVRPDMK